MHKYIYGISTAALLVAGMSGSTIADDKKGLYAGVAVGYTDARNKPLGLGFQGNAAESLKLGYAWKKGFRTEVEFTNFDADVSTGVRMGNYDSQNVAINVFYDFQTDGKFQPFVGAGLGGRWQDLKLASSNGVNVYDGKSRRKIWQAIAGVSYHLSDNATLGLDARYIDGFGDKGGNYNGIQGDLQQAGMFLGLNFFFGDQDSKPKEDVYTPPARPEPAPVVEQEPVYAPAPAPEPTPEPVVVELPGDMIIYFGFDSAELDWAAKQVVADAVAAYNEHGNAKITLGGHADRSGTVAYNAKLSQARADAVMAALVEAGVDASMVKAEAHGEHDTAVSTADGVRNDKNRRVEVTFSLGM